MLSKHEIMYVKMLALIHWAILIASIVQEKISHHLLGCKTASVTLLDAIAFLLLDRLTPHSYQWWKWGGVVFSLLSYHPARLLFPNLFACNWCDLGVSVATLRGFTYKLRVRGEQNTNDDVQPRVRCSFTGSGYMVAVLDNRITIWHASGFYAPFPSHVRELLM